MRNIKSLIKDDDAIIGLSAFTGIAFISSVGGCIEHLILNAAIITCPAFSSAIGATIRDILSVASTWCANILTA